MPLFPLYPLHIIVSLIFLLRLPYSIETDTLNVFHECGMKIEKSDFKMPVPQKFLPLCKIK